MKLFILINKKHGHVVGVYVEKQKCEKAKDFLNSLFKYNYYEIVEEKIILKYERKIYNHFHAIYVRANDTSCRKRKSEIRVRKTKAFKQIE